MKGNVSRNNFEASKRYSRVYHQQGRMITDADQNVSVDIVHHHIEECLKDIVGDAVPKGRALKIINDAGVIKIKPGIVYADGVYAQLPGDVNLPINFDAQADLPVNNVIFNVTNKLIYADIWDKSVDALDDADLIDVALSADTTTRTQRIVQIKTAPIDTDINTLPSQGTARLSVKARFDAQGQALPIENNSLLRVEVHQVRYNATGLISQVTIKWSRNNAIGRYRLSDLPQNDPLFWPVYEFSTSMSDYYLGHFINNSEDFRLPDLCDDLSELDAESPDFLRVWDGFCVLEYGYFDTVWQWQIASVSTHLEDGDVQVVNQQLQIRLTMSSCCSIS